MHKYILAIFFLVSGLTVGLQAQNAYDAIHFIENESGFGTRALAMGGAYSGLADDYSALYWNPAGLGYIRSSIFSVELSHLNYQNDAGFTGINTFDSQAYTRLRSLGFALPIPTARGSCVIALGYNKITDYDQILHFSGYSSISNGIGFYFADENDEAQYYPFDKEVQRSEYINTSGGLNYWSLGSAVALSPQFMAGATFSLINGQESYNLFFNQIDINNVFNSYPGDIDQYEVNQYLLSDIYGLDIKLGGSLQLMRWLRLGGTITLPSHLTVKETYSSDDRIIFDDGTDDKTDDSGQWKYTIRTPYNFDGGIAFTGRFLTLSVSARYRDWSQTQFRIPDNKLGNSDYRELIDENNVIRNTYRPTTDYRLGGEIKLPFLHSQIRGGYGYYPNPLIKAHESRAKHVYTTGLSFTVDRNINLELTHIKSDWSRKTEDHFTPAGTLENISTNKLLIGLSYRF